MFVTPPYMEIYCIYMEYIFHIYGIYCKTNLIRLPRVPIAAPTNKSVTDSGKGLGVKTVEDGILMDIIEGKGEI